jgi:UDP-N-acetylglucosamine acyltransferase
VIHPAAVVDAEARLGRDVSIGPYAVIGAGVEIGDGTSIGPHAVIRGPTRIGRNNRIFQFCSIGDDPQDKKYAGERESALEIGDRNVIREYTSINSGTAHGGGRTRIGNDNWIMAYVHIAHDCVVGDGTVFANNATLAGHVTVGDYTILGGFTGVHQFCRVGSHSFSAIASVIVKDVPPYLMVQGNTARPHGLNREGLKRYGFEPETVQLLRRAYRILYREGHTLGRALELLEPLAAECAEVRHFADFIRQSVRGIVR